jgi:hypothetical protein
LQGAHPFTPYAITSPNGNADASVRHDNVSLIFLLLMFNMEANAPVLSRELLLVKQVARPLKEKTKIPRKNPKEV